LRAKFDGLSEWGELAGEITLGELIVEAVLAKTRVDDRN
jgi:hypothetical protein